MNIVSIIELMAAPKECQYTFESGGCIANPLFSTSVIFEIFFFCNCVHLLYGVDNVSVTLPICTQPVSVLQPAEECSLSVSLTHQ